MNKKTIITILLAVNGSSGCLTSMPSTTANIGTMQKWAKTM